MNLDQILKEPDLKEKFDVCSLNATQLEEIRTSGTFSVPSIKFPGQNHVWELNWLLQKGKDFRTKEFRNGIALGCEKFVIYVPDSIYQSKDLNSPLQFNLVNGITRGFWSLVEFFTHFVGNAEYVYDAPNLEVLRQKMLFRSLISGGHTQDQDTFITGDGIEILYVKKYFSLFFLTFFYRYRHFYVNALKPLHEPFEQMLKTWNLNEKSRRKQIHTEHEAYDGNLEELNQLVIDNEALEFQEQILQLVHEHVENRETAELICTFILSISAIRQQLYNWRKLRREALQKHSLYLKETFPILSKIPEWTNRRLNDFGNKWDKEYPAESAFRRVFQALPQDSQERYLFKKNLELTSAIREKHAQETRTRAKRTYKFEFRRWLKSNWEVNENSSGRFTLEKHVTRHTSTWYSGWRFINMGIRALQFANNGLFGIVSNFIYGPFGLRAWVGLDDFQPDQGINAKTGEITSVGPIFSTFLGRIRNIARHISRSRSDFENAPDTGFFSKKISRPFHWAWNYLVKGALGIPTAFLGHTLLGLGNILVTAVTVATTPVWSSGLSILHYLTCILLYVQKYFFNYSLLMFFFRYDFDAIGHKIWFPLFRLLLWDFLICGVGQTVFSPLSTIAFVVTGVVQFTWFTSGLLCRAVWDGFIFHTFIKHFSRVPDRDSFLARRIRGPGLSVKYHQIIDFHTALLALRLEIEKERVNTFKRQKLEEIGKPIFELEEYYKQFSSVGLLTDHSTEKWKSFRKTREILSQELQKNIFEYYEKLPVSNVYPHVFVRFTRDTLYHIVEVAAHTAEAFFSECPDEWWQTKQLEIGDYHSLGILFLKTAFHSDITTPIEECDKNGFRITINHLHSTDFVRSIYKGTEDLVLDDLESVTIDAKTPFMRYPSPNVITVTPKDVIIDYEDCEKFTYMKKLIV